MSRSVKIRANRLNAISIQLTFLQKIQISLKKWWEACKQTLPVYIALHALFLAASWLTPLFIMSWNSHDVVPFSTLWKAWGHWDTAHYLHIAKNGYADPFDTAYFPLYPLLIRAVTFFTHNAPLSALAISNIANLLLLMVLYQLVAEEFGTRPAQRTILYLSVFPMAFFLVAAYTESLFLCLVLFTFYHLRRGNWLLAGLFGLFASMTRSAGILLVLPFCFEYLRQHQFQIRQVRWNFLTLALLPVGTGLYALFCWWQFNDPFKFAHVQYRWNRVFSYPWQNVWTSVMAMAQSKGPLSYVALHNVKELLPVLFTLVLLVLGLIGPWSFRRDQFVYLLYGFLLFAFNLSSMVAYGPFPLESQARYSLQIFPAFMVLALIGKHRSIHLTYLLTSITLLVGFLLQFLMGNWIT